MSRIKRFSPGRPLRSVIEQSRHAFMPGIRSFSLFEIIRGFKRQIGHTSLPERAAAISFNVFMAIPPTLLFLFTLVPLLPISQQFIRELFTIIREIVPGEKNNTVIIGFLRDFLNRPRTGLLSFGLLLAIFFSSNAMMGILRSFDKKYEGFESPSGFQKRKTALKLSAILFVLIFMGIVLLIAQNSLLKWVGIRNSTVRSIITWSRWVVILFLIFWSVSLIYRHGAAVTRKWPILTPGSLVATSMMIVATALVSFWVNNFSNYNKLYGSISAVFILMSLIWVNALALLVGFELNVTLVRLRRRTDPDADAGFDGAEEEAPGNKLGN